MASLLDYGAQYLLGRVAANRREEADEERRARIMADPNLTPMEKSLIVHGGQGASAIMQGRRANQARLAEEAARRRREALVNTLPSGQQRMGQMMIEFPGVQGAVGKRMYGPTHEERMRFEREKAALRPQKRPGFGPLYMYKNEEGRTVYGTAEEARGRTVGARPGLSVEEEAQKTYELTKRREQAKLDVGATAPPGQSAKLTTITNLIGDVRDRIAGTTHVAGLPGAARRGYESLRGQVAETLGQPEQPEVATQIKKDLTRMAMLSRDTVTGEKRVSDSEQKAINDMVADTSWMSTREGMLSGIDFLEEIVDRVQMSPEAYAEKYASGMPRAMPEGPVDWGSAVTVQSVEEAANLPSGTPFILDGARRIRK